MSRRVDQRPRDTVLVLDVDGVLLDPERAGKGSWQGAFRERFEVEPSLLDGVFFQRSWSEVLVGREPIEPALARALSELGWEIDVESVLRCWFEADYEIDYEVVRTANGWAAAGIRLALATNQEARRAGFLELHLRPVLPFDGMVFSGGLGVLKNDVAFYPAAEHWLALMGIAIGSSSLMTLRRTWKLPRVMDGTPSTSTSKLTGAPRSPQRWPLPDRPTSPLGCENNKGAPL